MLNPSSGPDLLFAITCSRRNGIDRMSLVGTLDHSSVLMLEGELDALGHEGGALVVDLHGLTSIDRWGLHTLERVARRSDRGTSRLYIVNGFGPVLDAFEAAGMGDLLSGTDLSDLLEAGDGEWSPVSLPPLPGRRADRRVGVAEERP